MALQTYDPEVHYDRVMPAWTLLMSQNLHYGYFQAPDDDLETATHQLTLLMARGAQLGPGLDALDVGCGTGQTACFLAEHLGCRITGISTARKSLHEARRLARTRGLTERVKFLFRDGTDSGFPDASFDRVWVLQTSHFVLDKHRLFRECARVLRGGGRLVLGDVMLRSALPMAEVVRLRREFLLLHQVFGRTKLEPFDVYRSLAETSGFRVETLEDISDRTLPTFDRWRRNAWRHRDQVTELVGETLWSQFVEACDVLEGFWAEGKLGYGVMAAVREG